MLFLYKMLYLDIFKCNYRDPLIIIMGNVVLLNSSKQRNIKISKLFSDVVRIRLNINRSIDSDSYIC